MALLVISLLALAVGPLLVRIADRARGSLSMLDGFVMVTISGLVAVHIIPHSVATAGVWALVLALVGFIVPGLIEHTLHRAARQAHTATLILAIGGLIVHAFFDGVALAAPITDKGISILAIAVALHRLPVAITVWWLLRPLIGKIATLGVLTLIGAVTIAGFGFEDQAALLETDGLALFQALIAGSLLHVVLHRPAPIAAPRATGTGRVYAGFGALVGLAAVAMLADEHLPLQAAGEIGFSGTFMALAIESAPALLLAFALAGVVQVVLPHASLRWLTTGRPMSESVRGVAFGLPLPICSCGVIPLYQTLVNQAVPATAAMAFLVATPELGIDAILISLPLLGGELTAVRVVCATIVALAVGWGVGRFAKARSTIQPPKAMITQDPGSWLQRAKAGLRFGFGEIVDHTGPWLLLGVAVASLVEPLLRGDWIAVLPWGVDVVLFALIGMPTYVCASGATPLVAVLIHKGVSPGAAIAFLLAGPATNVTTFGILAKLHGKRVALLFGGVIASLSVALGLSVNALLPNVSGIPLHEAATEHASIFGTVALAGLALAFGLSILRQGPRGFIGQVLSPYGESSHDHDHDHDTSTKDSGDADEDCC